MVERQTLGKRIASLRGTAGLSQTQLAAKAGVPTGTLKNWEQDLRQPYASALAGLAVALGVEAGPLLEGVTFPTAEKPGRAGRPRKAPPAAGSKASGQKPR
jgi:transcriptional regulator with XRE-family HTH domain